MSNPKTKSANTTAASDTDTAAAPQLMSYEVMAEKVKIGKVIAYRTARVNLTNDQADALNSAQPDTVRFLGI